MSATARLLCAHRLGIKTTVSSDYCVSLFSDCNGMEDLEGMEHGQVSVASNSIASLLSDGAVLGHIAIGLI